MQAEPALFQQGRHRAGAQRAIAFAQQEFRAVPAIELGHPAHDAAGEGIGIAIHAINLARRLAFQHARPAGAGGVDEHHIGHVQQAVGVGTGLEILRGHAFRLVGLHPHRAEAAHVQPDGGRTGAAIVKEGDGPVAGAISGVAGVKQADDRLAGIIAHRQRAGLRGIGDGLALDGHAALGSGQLFLNRWLCGGGLNLAGFGGLGILRECRSAKRQSHDGRGQ